MEIKSRACWSGRFIVLAERQKRRKAKDKRQKVEAEKESLPLSA